jgi:hypothetical protein
VNAERSRSIEIKTRESKKVKWKKWKKLEIAKSQHFKKSEKFPTVKISRLETRERIFPNLSVAILSVKVAKLSAFFGR